MKNIFRKIAATLMAFIVVFSTMSFTIDMHYCGGNLIDTAILKKAEKCQMENNSSSSEKFLKDTNCCSNQQITIEGQNELKTSFNSYAFQEQQSIASFIYTAINLFKNAERNLNSYTDYIPPPVVRQIYKIDETYLI